MRDVDATKAGSEPGDRGGENSDKSVRKERGRGRGRWACERSMGGGSKPPSRPTEEAIVTFRMGQVQVEGCGDCAASLR